ncbi:hypothetical protein D3H55_02400 [Bacillus salacetis]|uniref:Uncharacterized protein n=1 Tax=Bacillus salacetis TaxID=2315464 RepID=A0A3A1R7F4_9BACI|nr:hypothetical protein [Bacillus salacetis]RIW38407.1 hypothetical protein D3H55_02400 [Bacillus salacetis]
MDIGLYKIENMSDEIITLSLYECDQMEEQNEIQHLPRALFPFHVSNDIMIEVSERAGQLEFTPISTDNVQARIQAEELLKDFIGTAEV